MAKPLKSTFATDGSVDNTTTLFAGMSAPESIVLTAELSDTETEEFFVNSAKGAPVKGFAVIGDELIKYGTRFGDYAVRYLTRGVNGTTPVTHVVGTPVSLAPDYYLPPSIQEAIIALQEEVNSVKSRVTVLEVP